MEGSLCALSLPSPIMQFWEQVVRLCQIADSTSNDYLEHFAHCVE